MPSTHRCIARAIALLTLCLLSLPAVAAAQPGGPGSVPGSELSVFAKVAGGFLGTLVIGGILLAVFPRFTERVLERTREETGDSFVWGIGLLVAVIGLVFLLFITVIGVILAVPLLIAFVVVSMAGNAVGYIWILSSVVENDWFALLLGAAIAGVLGAIPVIGAVIGFVVGSLGTGAIAREYRLG